MAKQDIIISPAKVWYAPVGEALPDETTVAYDATWGGNWASLGKTLTPVAIQFEVEKFALTTEQDMLPTREIKTMLNAGFSTTLAEFTGANLALVLDGTKTTTAAAALQKGFDSIAISPTKTDIAQYAFGVEGFRVTSLNVKQPVRFFFPSATIAANGEITFAKGAGAGLPVIVTAMAPDSGDAVTVHNVTAAAS
jgi:hypothetical protein